MLTDSQEYDDFLKRRYLRGRGLYLNKIIYPQYASELVAGTDFDFGCGVGAFLEYCQNHHIPAFGIDSNFHMIRRCREKGLNVQLDNIVDPASVSGRIQNIVCDNVLEHLSIEELHQFFLTVVRVLECGGVLLVVTPNHRGYLSDPTHKTEVNINYIESNIGRYGLILSKWYRYPIKCAWLAEAFIYNMNIFIIKASL